MIKSKDYQFHPVIICDILNADGESLYPYYYAYMSIPAAERLDYLKTALLDDPSLEKALTPAFVRIKIASTDAEAIGDFSGGDVELTWGSFSAELDMTTDSKRSFATSASGIRQIIVQAIQENEESPTPAQESTLENNHD